MSGEERPPEPLFQPGEYGGNPLPGTEVLYNVRMSPDGQQIALIRSFTPEKPDDPHDQLWIVERDGSNPRLIGVNVGTVDWSPDGQRLALGVWSGYDTYDVQTKEVKQWTGKEDQVLSRGAAGNPVWFADGKKLLVSVWKQGYQQPFERGIYTIDTSSGETVGPLLELFQSAYLGGEGQYATGTKYTYDRVPLDGNFARYDFQTDQWDWITSFPYDSLDVVEVPVPSPTSDILVQSRKVEHAWQLFRMQSDGTGGRQITESGGDNPRWDYDGRQIFFRRDVHKGRGARYVPFVYDLTAGEALPLWPDQPDSMPAFPDLSTQALNRATGSTP